VTAVALLELTPDGRGLVAGTDEPMGPTGIGYGEIFRVATGARVADLGLLYAGLRSLPDGALLVQRLGDAPDRILTRDLAVAKAPFARSDDPIDLVMSSDGSWVARPDGTLVSVDGTRTVALERAEDTTPTAFAPDGAHLLGVGGDGRARIWRVSDGRSVK
jgi:hypothetical protein